MFLKIGCFVGLLHQPEENLPIQKSYINEYFIFVNKYKNVLQKKQLFGWFLAPLWCMRPQVYIHMCIPILYLKADQNRFMNNCFTLCRKDLEQLFE